MKKALVFLIIILAVSCRKIEKNNKVANTSFQVKKDSYLLSNKIKEIDTLEIYNWDTLSIESVKFNKKNMLFSLADLDSKKIDSISYDLWACGNPFEWMDEKYPADSLRDIHIKGSRYITNENSVLLMSSIIKNNELKFHNNIRINEFTTIDNFKKIFPRSYKTFIRAKKLNPENYVEYDYINIVFFKEQPSDHWIFYFKDGLLIKFELYWWLC